MKRKYHNIHTHTHTNTHSESIYEGKCVINKRRDIDICDASGRPETEFSLSAHLTELCEYTHTHAHTPIETSVLCLYACVKAI